MVHGIVSTLDFHSFLSLLHPLTSHPQHQHQHTSSLITPSSNPKFPSNMKDMAACFNEHAIRVSETTCSTHKPHIISQNPTPALQNAVVSTYKLTLSSKKHLFLTLTWSRSPTGHHALTISFNDDPSATFKLAAVSRLFRRRSGARSISLGAHKIELQWDLSEANYDHSVEPINGYYIMITIDSELGLALGDLSREDVKVKRGASVAEVSLISRREHYSGSTMLYSTKAQLSGGGATHEISIKSGWENDRGLKQAVLSVSVDRKVVMKVKKLEWNFRGNQRIWVDGCWVDLLWDVHDLFFNPGNGLGVFMFRRRSGSESSDFSLLIYASKSKIPMKEINGMGS